ncbi:Endocuticle structural glycoprotein SgAbd-2 [Papilio machaon]|uniref:Endocuticle structural glycoprotein SgAbd-2 n=1 Tax=Papilio machaon TaxID=76193 RepID=A0A0N1INI7_PAPMA|nr:Endocuticle structural glycoprotein SgAbd-2 [Papilio machaon]
MKLVYFFFYVNMFYASGEKVHQGQFQFPQNYPLTNSMVTSERSIYFPSGFQTLSPYFASNNYDDAYKLLPSIQAKLSNAFPTSFPILLTPTTDYKDGFQRRLESNEKLNKSVPTPFMYNQTKISSNIKEAERRTLPINTQVLNYKQIDRMDSKASTQVTPTTEATKPSTNSASKKFIISSENINNQDLEQKASFHNVHFAPPPNVYIQSTTEIAIPILRLSNEMDLDGSFSYEALGADQTHYVQHSRMENLGTDKESQVVEGSYSYVGDNGQTYTVHYIADSNGYRATGDHLPVPPPVPEIIQRSIQYNLAEEARKPPHLRYYYDDESDSIYNNDKDNQNYLPLQNNLFTGRTPEAFSFGLSQRSSLQNDLTSTNSKEPINQNTEFSEDKFKRNTNIETLEPQVTFLASQGASLPLNKPQKSTLPQLVNYDSSQLKPSSKESENAKALWRWQYGSNSNIESLNPTKNLISRSSSEGDDVIINFNEMTPMEYSKAIRNYENSLINSNNDPEHHPKADNSYNYSIDDKIMDSNNSFENDYYYNMNNHKIKTSVTEPSSSKFNDVHEPNLDNNLSSAQTSNSEDTFKVNKPYNFAVSTDTPKWLDYETVSYKPKLTSYNTDNINKYSTFEYLRNESDSSYSQTYKNKDNYEANFNEDKISSSTIIPSNYNYHQDQENKESKFQEVHIIPKRQEIITQNNKDQVTTTEVNINEMLRDNIFLRNLFKARKPDINQIYSQNKLKSESYKNYIIDTTPKSIDTDSEYVIITSPKTFTIRNEPTPANDIKFNEKKPFDTTDVLYYVINKNVFESNKLKSKRKTLQVNNNNKYGSYDLSNDSKNKEIKVDQPTNQNNFRLQPQQQEIRGILKNYKVIQRNNVRKANTEQENQSQNAHELKNQNLYSIKLPHLGRAGPSTKSYLPPVYL